MLTHTYVNLQYAILHSRDWVTSTGHRIHLSFETIYYDSIVME